MLSERFYMVFKAREENNGEIDENINVKGQFRKPVRLTNRQIREKEMLSLLRKIKPHVAEAIMTAADIMKNDEASHQNQLKAAVVLLDNYKDLVGDLYDKDYDEEANEEANQSNTPVFSLKVVNSGE